MRYAPDEEPVLKNVNILIQQGWKLTSAPESNKACSLPSLPQPLRTCCRYSLSWWLHQSAAARLVVDSPALPPRISLMTHRRLRSRSASVVSSTPVLFRRCQVASPVAAIAKPVGSSFRSGWLWRPYVDHLVAYRVFLGIFFVSPLRQQVIPGLPIFFLYLFIVRDSCF
ncbi:hypothetical protein EVAR_31695_1 [Eumeta japonica]|uniref:Uncharacterized protein n=1 Tax=Eumeta variegata TaxID=151549 RepID=A0A4C1VUA4_EUMVA|nr:hypothetical protein EVAR_31695_1 [Eumeta japonica]